MSIDNSLQKALSKHFVYDAWQFIMNTQKTITIACYCSDIIKNSIEAMIFKNENWQNEIFNNLFDKPDEERHVDITYEMLPQYETSVMGIQTSYPFLLDKTIKDFFQYIRNSFDCMAQICNAALLGNKSKERYVVDFPKMLSVFNQQLYCSDFPKVQEWFNKVNQDDLFRYVEDFNNRTKHTCDVSLNLAMSLISGDSTTNINKFYKKNQQPDKNILNIVSEIYSFTEKSFESLLILIKQEIQRELYIEGRYHYLFCYQQKIKNDEKSDLSIVYIKGEDCDILPNEIRVLLLSDSDNKICCKNCKIKNIFVQNSEEEYIAQYVIENKDNINKKDTLVEYVKYVRVKKTPFVGILEAIKAFKEDKIFYLPNPYMDLIINTNDEEFRKNIRL